MRSLHLAAPLLGLAASVSAGTISASLSKSRSLPKLARRDGNFDLDAVNNITGGGYYAEFEIGTPPQKLSFQLDTGSSDTWVNSDDANLCNSDEQQTVMGFCQTTFKPDDSKSFKTVDKDGFNITYVDGRNIVGDYFNDTVTINGNEIKNQQLGLALKSVRPTGLMGLGFSTNVAADTEYPTIIDNMVSQGYINTATFSLYLNELDADSGEILFGGVDTKKYVGKLASLDLVSISEKSSSDEEPNSYAVQLNDISIKGVDTGDAKTVAILDSGSTITLLPGEQATAIWDKFDVKVLQNPYTGESAALPLVNCDVGGKDNKGLTVDFKFGDKTIKVPMSELVIDSFDGQVKGSDVSPALSDWKKVCTFGIGNANLYGLKIALLGDTFLRSAYVLYDMANKKIGLAQANVGTKSSNIVEIKKASKDIPDDAGVEEQENQGNAAGHVSPAGILPLAVAFFAVTAAVSKVL